MAERLSDVEARIASIRQLSSVITAMRGIAAMRSSEARNRLPGIRSYASTIGQSIAEALALLPAAIPHSSKSADADSRRLVIAICAEQGFVGGFNGRVLDHVAEVMAGETNGHCELFLLGSRGLSGAEERGLVPVWTAPMAGQADQLSGLANRLADAIFERLPSEAFARIDIVHAAPQAGTAGMETIERMLVPFDFSRFPPTNLLLPPVTQVPVHTLLGRLAEEYVFAEMCEALMQSYAAENLARMHAMLAARENVAEKLEELITHARMLRQSQITEEVIELAAGTMQ